MEPRLQVGGDDDGAPLCSSRSGSSYQDSSDAVSSHWVGLQFQYAKSHLGTICYREGISTNVLHQVHLQKSAPKLSTGAQALSTVLRWQLPWGLSVL